jgi:Leucine-rich repeat (LRR) protein
LSQTEAIGNNKSAKKPHKKNKMNIECAIKRLIIHDSWSWNIFKKRAAPINNDVIKVIFSLTKETFHSLKVNEQTAVKKFYKAISKSKKELSPDLIKPFLAFRKTIFSKEEQKAANSIIVQKINTEFANVHAFLPTTDLSNMAASCKALREFSIEEMGRRLNQEKVSPLGFNKKNLFSFLLQQGHAVHKLSLDNMKGLTANDIERFINLCPNLTSLSLENCGINSGIATQIIKALDAAKITYLNLSYNQIEVIPPEIESFSQLQYLNLSHNRITIIVPEIENLFQLQKLLINDNQIEVIPPELVNLLQLRVLDIGYNKIEIILREIENLFQLQELNISSNNLQAIPPEIGNLSQLQVLNIQGNRIQVIPPEIGNLSQLKVLHISYNRIQVIPPEIGNLSQLQLLNIHCNRIQVIPPEIGNLSQLQLLYISYNRIQVIPPEIGNLSQLQLLHISYNRIQVIPPEIGNLSQLQLLNIQGNRIQVIPPEIGNLLQLQELDISRNEIKVVPPEIRKLLQLKKLNLDCNEITVTKALTKELKALVPNWSYRLRPRSFDSSMFFPI